MDYYQHIAQRHQQRITGSSVKQIQDIIEDVLSAAHQFRRAEMHQAYTQGYNDKAQNIEPRPSITDNIGKMTE